MPRDVSGNYSLPAGTAAVSSTTANSAHVNSRFSDLESDANTVRPIPVGGTGASSASGARTSLGLEIGADVQAFADALTALSSATPDADKLPYFTSTSASDVTDLSAFARTLLDDADAATARGTLSAMKGNQTTVTDWDTAIKDGHYYGDGSATNAPTAHAYVASIIRNDDNNLIQVAIRAGTGEVYIRARASGTFGSWSRLAAASEVTTGLPSPDFESSEISLVSDGDFSVSHGLGGLPKLISAVLVCKTTDAGYPVGAELYAAGNSGTNTGLTWAATSSAIVGSFGSQIPVNAIGSTSANLTFASWKLVLRAWQ